MVATYRLLLLLVVFDLSFVLMNVQAQGPVNHYYFGFFGSHLYSDNDVLSILLTTAETQPIQYFLESPASDFVCHSGNISADDEGIISLSASVIVSSVDHQDKGIYLRINSDKVAVIGQKLRRDISDSFFALPIVELDNVYVYYGVSVPRTIAHSYLQQSSILIVGTENNITMELIVTQAVNIGVGDTVMNLIPGRQYSFLINRLQTVFIESLEDLSGTKIVTDRPVSVLSGHQCGNVPYNVTYCSHLIEQIPPTALWNKVHYIMPLAGRRSYSFKVLAAYNSTTVNVYCNNITESFTINEGEFFNRTLQMNQYCAIYSNKNVLLVQLSHGGGENTGFYGDPMMTLVPATSQYFNKFDVSTIRNPLRSGYDHYVNIIVMEQYFQPNLIYLITEGGNTSLETLQWVPIQVNNITEAYATHVNISEGMAQIFHTNTMAKMMTIVYGFTRHDGYGHIGGVHISGAVQLQPSLHIFLQPSCFDKNTVGERQDVICSIDLPADVSPDTVEFGWLNQEDIATNDNRVTVTSHFNTESRSVITTIQFNPLLEDDEGTYTCYSEINGFVKSESIQLHNFRKNLIDNTDITFVVDTSGSISETNFQYIREFMEDIVLEMNIGMNNSRVAVILFNDFARLHFNLNEFININSLVGSIRTLPYFSGGTDIPEALNLLRTTAENGALGIRNDSRQVTIFLTDGVGGDIGPAIAALAATNIFQIYSVGVGSARLDQLSLIALNHSDRVYYHSDFTETSLAVIAKKIIERLKEKFIILLPRLGSMLGGTLIQLTGNNIKFNEQTTYTCLFDDTEVEGMYIAESGLEQIVCISPILQHIGRINFALKYSSMITGILVNDTFYSLPVEDTSAVETTDLLLQPGNQTIIHWSPSSVIPLNLLEDFGIANDFTVDISLYQLNPISENYTLIEKLATDIPNTGVYEITVPLIDETENITVTIIGISISEKISSQPTRNVARVLRFLRKAVIYTSVKYIKSSVIKRAACALWLLTEADNTGQMISKQLPPCPTNFMKANLNRTSYKEEIYPVIGKLLTRIFHPGAFSCFRQIDPTSQHGQQCCYYKNGTLAVGPKAGGTVDLYSPEKYFWKHLLHDVIPFLACCTGLFPDCSSYYNRRPSNNGDGYVCPPPARGAGDPHITTLDGFKYTFNGKGEFTLIDHVNGRFTLQGRMVDVPRDAIGSFASQQATVFSAVVGKQNDSDVVQFEINQQQNGIDVIVGGKKINLDGLYLDAFNNVTVFNLGEDGLAASFSSGCSIKVNENFGYISVFSINVPSSFKGLTYGLMGNYNGDTADDLIPRNSTEPLSHNSSTEIIHHEFGITWFINKTESLFTYNEQTGQSWELFYDPFFQPLFTISEDNPLFESVCENDTFCLYDITATGNTEIGLLTLNISKEYDQLVQLSYPVICVPPCDHGACVANDTCNCVEGYVGERCTEPVYSECEVELCTNGGTCRKLGSSYICECVNGYSGLDCEIAPATGNDGDNDSAVVIGITITVVALLLLLVLIITCSCFFRRSRKY